MRLDKHVYFCSLAKLASLRGTCSRRQVGCVLVDSSYRVLSTGYNGVPRGVQHCTDVPCAGAHCPSGTGLDLCEATHAEINALLQCQDIDKIQTCFVTHSPCVQCVKALMNTGCWRIVFLEEYPHPQAKEWWLRDTTRVWEHLVLTDQEKQTIRSLYPNRRDEEDANRPTTTAQLDDTH